MNNRISFVILFFSIIFILPSCTHRIVDYTIISTKNVDLSKSSTFERGKTRNKGVDRVYWLITIPLGIPNMKEAIDRAIEQTPGAVALVDGVVYSKSMWFIFSGYSQYLVEGTPLVDPSLAVNLDALESSYNVVVYNKKGEIEEVCSLTEEEYMLKKQNLGTSK